MAVQIGLLTEAAIAKVALERLFLVMNVTNMSLEVGGDAEWTVTVFTSMWEKSTSQINLIWGFCWAETIIKSCRVHQRAHWHHFGACMHALNILKNWAWSTFWYNSNESCILYCTVTMLLFYFCMKTNTPLCPFMAHCFAIMIFLHVSQRIVVL